MSQEQLPGTPGWMDEDVPPPEADVRMDESTPLRPEWLSFEGGVTADSGERHLVRASAEREHRDVLRCFTDSLQMRIEVVPDPPELADRLRELDELAPAVDVATTLDRARDEAEGPIVLLEVDPLDTGSSVAWVAAWATLSGGANAVWHGPKWVKMQVHIGSADLRGIVGGSPRVEGGQESAWEIGNGRCTVHAFRWSEYRLSAGWRR